MQIPPFLSRTVLVGVGTLLCAGCISRPPPPAYRNVDREAPIFKEAVARETERQREQGKSPTKAEEIATAKVTRQIIKAEKDRRIEQVAPLVAALTAFDRPRGCWAYTTTTTTRKADKTTVDVERYDAFQPEARLWTLVSRDGQAPDAKTQADYRRAKLRAWRTQLKRTPRYSATERVNLQAVWSEMEITPTETNGLTTFTFIRGHAHVAMVGDIPSMREVYVTENASNTVLGHTRIQLEPAAMLGGAVNMEKWDSTTDYVVIEPELPPFVSKLKTHYQGRFFGKDTGDVEIETVYSDYRRVKCYDDRFEVRIGEPTMSELLPDRE